MVTPLFISCSTINNTTHWDISELQNAINIANTGHLPPTFVTSDQLSSVLQSIADRLPAQLKLPSVKLAWYYAHLATALIPQGNKIHLIAALPLAHREAMFTIFESISVPVPNPSANLVARCHL